MNEKSLHLVYRNLNIAIFTDFVPIDECIKTISVFVVSH